MSSRREAAAQGVHQRFVADVGERFSSQLAIVPRGGKDARSLATGPLQPAIGRAIKDGAERRPEKALEVPQRRIGEGLHVPRHEELIARFDQEFEATATLVQGADLLIGADRRREGRDEAGVGELGLGAVIVDVVVADHAELGRIARLPGAQDDPRVAPAEFLANDPDQGQPGIVALHDHIEKDHRHIRVPLEHGPRLERRGRVQQFELAAADGHPPERKQGGLMHFRIIIDDENFPGTLGRRCVGRFIVFEKLDELFGASNREHRHNGKSESRMRAGLPQLVMFYGTRATLL